ncbi:hypothetical protein XENORESO_003131 [Xenotaenia resolanae]|uniref:Uncharacterized protein n=1 Tax=Xenotaenia resolanae TaxID=208358 RepID=A0ABV0WPN5_9TELE
MLEKKPSSDELKSSSFVMKCNPRSFVINLQTLVHQVLHKIGKVARFSSSGIMTGVSFSVTSPAYPPHSGSQLSVSYRSSRLFHLRLSSNSDVSSSFSSRCFTLSLPPSLILLYIVNDFYSFPSPTSSY